MGVHSEIFQIDVATRQWKPLTERRPLHPADLEPSCRRPGQMVFQFDEPTRFGDVWTLAIPATRTGAAAAPMRVTGVFDALDRDVRAAAAGEGRVEGRRRHDDRRPALLSDRLRRPARRYPLVVQMHGGPADSDKFGAGPGLLLNYFPVLDRPRATPCSGRTTAAAPATATRFYRDVVGGYFKNMHLDVMAGVDALVKRGIADPDRLVAMGWSAGGHLTNKLITMTTASRPPRRRPAWPNWMSMYAQTRLRARTGRVWFGGTPWQKNAPIAIVLEQLAAQGRREREDADAVLRRRE